MNRVNKKIATHKDPILVQLKATEKQIQKVTSNIEKYLTLFEKGDFSSTVVKKKIEAFENERSEHLERKKDLEQELSKPTIQEVSFDQVQQVLSQFSLLLPKVEPEKQKELLYTIVNKITVNQATKPRGNRTIKEIELFFDLSPKKNLCLLMIRLSVTAASTNLRERIKFLSGAKARSVHL